MTKKEYRSRHNRMKSCFNGTIKEENEDLSLDEEVGGNMKRKLSWNEDRLDKSQKEIDNDEEEIDEAHKKEMDNEQLLKNYGALLKEIDHDYKIKKEFEEEIKARLEIK